MPTLRRRTFLRGLGAGLLGLPVLGSLGTTARASTGFPTRVIFVAQGQGSLMDQLVVPGTGATDFSFGPILQALTPFRERIALIGGIDDATNILDGNYNGHTRCLHHTWSCKGMTWSGSANGSYPSSSGGTTIDQLIASRISSERPWTSLEFGVEASSNLMLSHFC